METHPADGPTCILKVSTCRLGWQWLPHFTKLWPPKFTKKKRANSCCKGCAAKIKKKLQKINGVTAITIDYEKGLVAVSGEIDPTTIIITISKLKMMAEIVSYKKDPRGVLKKKQEKKQAQWLKKKAHNNHHNAKNAKNSSHYSGHDYYNHSKSKLDLNSYSDSDSDECPDHRAHKIGEPNMTSSFVAPHGKGYYPKSRPEFPPGPYGAQKHWAPGMYGRPPPGPFPALPPIPPSPMPPPTYGYGHHHSSMMPLPQPPPLLPSHMYPYYQLRSKERPVGNSMMHYFSDDNTSACTIM